MKFESGRAPIKSGTGTFLSHESRIRQSSYSVRHGYSFWVMKAESDRAPIKSGMGTFEVMKGASMTPLRLNKFVVSTSVIS